jgi:hypothetical protein
MSEPVIDNRTVLNPNSLPDESLRWHAVTVSREIDANKPNHPLVPQIRLSNIPTGA